jgi:hypothetical protein
MEYSTDPDDVGTVDSIEEKMTWLPDYAAFEPGAFAAMPEMIAANVVAKLERSILPIRSGSAAMSRSPVMIRRS